MPLVTAPLGYEPSPLTLEILTHPPDFGMDPSTKAAPQTVEPGLCIPLPYTRASLAHPGGHIP